MGSWHYQELLTSPTPHAGGELLGHSGIFSWFFHACWWFGVPSATSGMPGGCGGPTLAGKAGSDSLPSPALPAG